MNQFREENKIDLNDICAEIQSTSMIITALANPLDEDCTQLLPAALKTALYGVSRQLDRIAEDLDVLDI
ncbi:hypothetical protein DWX43_19150 [Clostridium sp. AF19-22AC]|jgi:hypothetical protein|uniref:hypothetical protein n=1 Tax=Clostridia TaxID=186801 RepID=UPI000E5230F4|nr:MULTISPECIES: hypothetical protein [Clostridia]RHR24760.1 hypothetical protein DWX43_19150 [Clostridium sp. AF19-22AC]DAQ34354.1 MAG TPA: hypothetical protein [Caudoviricetes sp.]